MTDEQLKKANELKNKIEKYNSVLSSINSGLSIKKKKDEESRKRIWDWQSKWTLKKFFTFSVDKKDNKKAYLSPHYELSCGTAIDVEEDFVLMVMEYFKEKKEQAEKEFEDLR